MSILRPTRANILFGQRMKTNQPTANREKGWRPSQRFSRFLLIYFFCLLAVTIVYHKTPITFFRTETGEWLRLAHSPPGSQHEVLREFWTTSSHGHYTPLAFSAEFLFTKWADTKSLPWQARQLAVLALLAAAFFVVVRSMARMLEFPNRGATCIGIGLTTAFICQPLMREMIGWPFHIFQVAWMILMLATLAALLELLAHPDERKWLDLRSDKLRFRARARSGFGHMAWDDGCFVDPFVERASRPGDHLSRGAKDFTRCAAAAVGFGNRTRGLHVRAGRATPTSVSADCAFSVVSRSRIDRDLPRCGGHEFLRLTSQIL